MALDFFTRFQEDSELASFVLEGEQRGSRRIERTGKRWQRMGWSRGETESWLRIRRGHLVSRAVTVRWWRRILQTSICSWTSTLRDQSRSDNTLAWAWDLQVEVAKTLLPIYLTGKNPLFWFRLSQREEDEKHHRRRLCKLDGLEIGLPDAGWFEIQGEMS